MSLVAARPVVSSGGLEGWSVELLSRFVDHAGRITADTRRQIASAETAGAIARIDAGVLRSALDLLRAPRGRHLRVQVNVSPRSLVHPGFVEEWTAHIRVAGLEPGRLVVETGAAAIAAQPATHAPLRALHSAGAGLALDGVQASGEVLDVLGRLPLAQVKLAGTQVRAAADGDAVAIGEVLRTGLAARMRGVCVVATGVETATQLALARDSGCDLVQGDLVGPAVLVAGLRRVRGTRVASSRRTRPVTLVAH